MQTVKTSAVLVVPLLQRKQQTGPENAEWKEAADEREKGRKQESIRTTVLKHWTHRTCLHEHTVASCLQQRKCGVQTYLYQSHWISRDILGHSACTVLFAKH